MKKLILTLAVVAMAAFTANAQVYVGGGLGIGQIKDADTEFYITPEVGYNFNDSWAVGGSLGYDSKSEAFSVEPYARWTYLRQGIVSLFLDGAVGMNFVKVAGENETGFSVGIKPGIAVKLSRNLSMVSHMGFLGFMGENSTSAGSKEFTGLDFGSKNLGLSFYYNF